MNLFEAMDLLELSDNYSLDDLKKNYKSLALKYHPDKCKNPEDQGKFIKIGEAYSLLLKKNTKEPENFIDSIFKSFVNISKQEYTTFSKKTFSKSKRNIELTAKEFLTGCRKKITKELSISCNCEPLLCKECSGCGYNLNLLNICSNCLGNGWIRNCNKCSNGLVKTIVTEEIEIEPCNVKQQNYGIVISEKEYKIHNTELRYYLDITLKESLIGFKKTFKDPFEKNHDIVIDMVIKTNDGYRISDKIIIIFNVIYPKNISSSTKQILKNLDL